MVFPKLCHCCILNKGKLKFPPGFNLPLSINTNTRLLYRMEKYFQYFLCIPRTLCFNLHKETIFARKYVINPEILFFIALISKISLNFEAKNVNKVKAFNETCYWSNERAVIRLAFDYLFGKQMYLL